MGVNLIISVISIVFALVVILIGIWITVRLAGKLRNVAIFLIVSVIVFIIAETLEIINFLTISDTTLIENITHLLIILFILFAAISMKNIIDSIIKHKL